MASGDITAAWVRDVTGGPAPRTPDPGCLWEASPPSAHQNPGCSCFQHHAKMDTVAAEGNELLTDSPKRKIDFQCYGFLRGGGLRLKI